MEKRVPIAIIVQFAPLEGKCLDAAELTYTNDVSSHGACVISKRSWKIGEMAEVSSLEDERALRGRVIHCEKRSDERYAVGLVFLGDQVTWSRYLRYACPPLRVENRDERARVKSAFV